MDLQFIGYVIADTNRAILFHDHFWESPVWWPKSQISVFQNDDTQEVSVSVAEWLCEKNHIQEFKYRPENSDVRT